jgi:hypothetical protein
MPQTWGQSVAAEKRAAKRKERERKARARRKKINTIKHPGKALVKRYLG